MALRPKVNLVVLDPGSGKARPGAWVTVYHANTLDKPTLYADDDVAALPNPVQANGLGQVAVRVESGTYDVSMTWDGAQPTVVEDVLAWTPEADVITQPGDLIIGGPAGENLRLAVGTAGQVLLVENGLPTWRTLKGGVGLPPGSPGSILSYGANNDLSSILPGLQDQALVMQGGIPSWASILEAGQVLPINQPGDLVVGAVTTGVPTRLARGATDQVLRTDASGGLVWGATDSIGPGGGTCWLALEAGLLVLQPWQGNQVWVAGRARTIPDAGTAGLSAAGLSPSVTYYIYVAWTGSALVLEASTTGWAETGGLTHKSSDPTRTLVGMARTLAGPAWGVNPNQQFLLSFFYPFVGHGTASFTAPRTKATPHPTWEEIHPEIRVEFLCWGWERTIISLDGQVQTSVPNITVASVLTLDAGPTFLAGPAMTSSIAGEWSNIATTHIGAFAEGYHYVTLLGASQGAAGTATWHGDPSGIHAGRISTVIVGSG